MNIYFIERILLDALSAHRMAPKRGDHVVFFRDAQDIDGTASERMKADGIRVEFGPSLIDSSHKRNIDEFVRRYLKTWFIDNGRDVSRDGDFSLGLSFSGALVLAQHPVLIAFMGEVVRSVLKTVTPGATIHTDIQDGLTMFTDELQHPEATPRHRLIQCLADEYGCACADLTVENPVPSVNRSDSRTGVRNPYWDMLRTYLGGFRPNFILGRLAARFGSKKGPGIYVYSSHGIQSVTNALAENRDIRIYSNITEGNNAIPLRHDHLIALPSSDLRQAAKGLRGRLATLLKGETETGLFMLDGYDYAPFLLPGLKLFLDNRLKFYLIKIAQGIKLFRKFDIDITIVNGSTPYMYGAIGYTHRFGKKTMYIPHGLNLFFDGHRDDFLNYTNVIYAAIGTDHLNIFGPDLPEELKPRTPVLGNPATEIMNSVMTRRTLPQRKRVLLSNFSAQYANNCARFHLHDRYMIDLLTAARTLLDRGWDVSYRPHHGEEDGYIFHIMNLLGLEGRVKMDNTLAFKDALSAHDVFVANTTSCIYQSLYAGWPTIFYDPEMDIDYLVGLPVATDIYRPIASTPDELVALVEQTQNSESEISKFPEAFRTTHAERFIGPNADRAHEVIANFITKEVSRKESPAAVC